MIKNIGIYENLVAQLERTARHNKQCSYKTRTRYFEAMKRFCAFLADEYRLQKLSNISAKHIESYVEYMQKKGLSAATVKVELTAIRFIFDQMPNTRHTLPGNDELNLEKRQFGGVDRTCTAGEFNRMIALCWKLGREDYAVIITIAYYAALRIEEVFRLDRSQAETAIKTGILTFKGKNGLVRSVPIQESIRIELEKMLEVTTRGSKLFVAENNKTHLAKKRLQNFIDYHRSKIQDEDSTRPMTYHGLRHTAAARWYEVFRKQGCSDYSARLQVSKFLGHHRDDITRLYLVGVKGDEAKGRDDYEE